MTISIAQRARLGIFVIVGTTLILAFIGVSLGLKYSNKTKIYYTYFQGESMSGLEEGALVKYSGVPIGKVESIRYQPDDLSKVKVTLSIKADFPMKQGMYATAGLMGITGLKYVELLGGTSTSPTLKPGVEIPTRVSTLSTISGKAEVIVAKVELLLNHLNSISDPDSLRSVKVVLDNIAAITTDVRTMTAGITPKVDTMTGSAASLIARVDSIAADIKSFTGMLENTLSEQQVTHTMGLIDSTARSLKSLTENLRLTVMQTREDFSVSMQNLRQASESASELTRMLAENPSLLIKGETQKERDVR
ncbi:MAG: MlaD family protein [Chitinispirillaceae bacterium]|nr:MlaD family protein [Chitinispirillaceae bacterium]